MTGDDGQATIETVALIPLVVCAVAAVAQFLAAGAAREQAASAAQAGVVALLQDGDPEAAVKDTLGEALERSVVTMDGRTVRVAVKPRAFAAPLADLLEATAAANAGAHAAPVARTVIRGGDGESSRPEDDRP